MDALECLKTRRSVREYLGDPIDRPVLEDIVECARLAPSARNTQPCSFVVIVDPSTIGEVAGMTDHGKFMANAPCMIAVLSEDVKYFLEDSMAATQNILLAARAHGLGSCWVAADKKPYARAIADKLGAPDNVRLVSLIAVGKPKTIPEPVKKPLAEVIHWERY
jgi:nitroreductase